MSRDSRLARVVHVLIHMDNFGGVLSSETIGVLLDTNPVVVRRLLGRLRAAGYVQADRGPGGGWRPVKRLDEVTLLELHRLLRDASIISVAPSQDHATCRVEAAANHAIENAGRAATQAFEDVLGRVTLADVRARAARVAPAGQDVTVATPS